MKIRVYPAVVPSSFTLQIYEIIVNYASKLVITFTENESFSAAAKWESGKVGKWESGKVSYGQEAKTGMCDGNTAAL